MKRLSSLVLSFAVAFGLLFAAGCDSSGSDGGSGTLALRMDAASSKVLSSVTAKSGAATVKEALVTIDKVSIVPSNNSSEENGTDTGVKVLSDSNFTVDLVNLQDGLDTLVTNITIPAGNYSQLRLVTNEMVSVQFDDGSTKDVMIASGQQTGLKVNFDPFEIESSDDRVELTINWDVNQFFNDVNGYTGQRPITPVIDATIDTTSVGN